MSRRSLLAVAVGVGILLGLALANPVQPIASHDNLNGAVNAYRSAHGLSVLTTNATLETVAHERAVEISTNWTHNANQGTRIGCWHWGEVIASGSGDPAATVQQWANSPPHKTVMELPWVLIGSGQYQASWGTVYSVVLFLVPCTSPPPSPPQPPPLQEIPDTSMTP